MILGKRQFILSHLHSVFNLLIYYLRQANVCEIQCWFHTLSIQFLSKYGTKTIKLFHLNRYNNDKELHQLNETKYENQGKQYEEMKGLR